MPILMFEDEKGTVLRTSKIGSYVPSVGTRIGSFLPQRPGDQPHAFSVIGVIDPDHKTRSPSRTVRVIVRREPMTELKKQMRAMVDRAARAML